MARIWLILVSLTVIWKPQTQATIKPASVQTAAEDFGANMYDLSIKFSGKNFLEQAFEGASASLIVKEINGTEMVIDIADKIEKMLDKKVEAVEKLVEAAENASLKHEYNDSLEYTYFNALLINDLIDEEGEEYLELGGEFILTPDDHFNGISVNLTQSTVQVPTNVYNMGTEVLNHIKFTEQLDSQFEENYAADPTLTWQYFGSKTGFFRNFPGIKWDLGEASFDKFDCRKRGWYISAATSPKDIVILIDKSGSMLGILLEIAKHTARTIIDTLGDDDFFNVLAFNDTTSYTEPCFEDGMLVQANADNRELIKDSLDSLEAGGFAEFGNGLKDAFELLDKYNKTTIESQCNQAIIVITDGASKTHEEIFEEYNVDKNVRVFTYLMGREVGGAPALKWMACENNGYYTQIATIADVDENVSKYIHVLSRPMVIKQIYNTVWTNVYMDDAASDEGLALMTTVAQPVFDKKNDTVDQGILLGVVGVDVPVQELLKLTPVYKLGARGYPFAITNNGYILFHPDLRPKWGDEIKPNYNSVDLAEVELSDIDDTMRNAMIDTLTGEIKIQATMHTSNLTRISVRNNSYFYTFLNETPFSFAIVLVEPYGFYLVESTDSYLTCDDEGVCIPEQQKLFEATEGNFFDGDLTIAQYWPYCSWSTEENKLLRKNALVDRLFLAVQENQLATDCDGDMINHLLFDIKITEGVPDYWETAYSDVDAFDYFCYPGPPFSSSSNLTTPTPSRCPSSDSNCFTSMVTNMLERTTPISQSSRDWNETETRSERSANEESKVCVKISNHSATENGIVSSFLGTRGGLTRWYNNPDFEVPDNSTRNNTETIEEEYSTKDNTETIEEDYYWRAVELGNDRILYSVPLMEDGHLIDDNSTLKVTASTILTFSKDGIGPTVVAALGYEMYWNNFASNLVDATICGDENIDCLLLDENAYIMFSENDGEVGEHFGKSYLRLMTELMNVSVYDKYQLVDYQGMCTTNEIFSNAGSTIFDPFFSMTTLVAWWFHQIVVFLVQFSLHDWWYSLGVQAEYLQPKVISNPCDQIRDYFKLKPENLPFTGFIEEACASCKLNYSIHAVPKSNLVLLAMDNDCQCDPIEQLDILPTNYNTTDQCQRLLEQRHRRRPPQCHNEVESDCDDCDCGRGCFLQPSLLLLLACYCLHQVSVRSRLL